MKVLVAGWFSFEKCNVTAGDLMARDIACKWLESSNYSYDVAIAPPLTGGVNWQSVNPNSYSHVVFVCGPFPLDKLTTNFINYFSRCRLIGLNLSMIEPLDIWNPFDVLLARDSSVGSHPDIAFLSNQTKVPIVGVILVHPQQEYGDKGKHEIANAAIERLIASKEMAVVYIDTGLDPNTTNLRSAAEIESLIALMDIVVTTRLHGTVLALKNSVPVIAIDPISGGAKILCQTKTIGWSLGFSIDNLSDATLQSAFEYCLTQEAREKVKECRDFATKLVEQVFDEFIAALDVSESSSTRLWSPIVIEKTKSLEKKTSLGDAIISLRYQITGGIRRWLLKKLYRESDAAMFKDLKKFEIR